MNPEQGNSDQIKKVHKKRVRSVYLFPAYDFGLACQIARTVEEVGAGSLSEETLAVALGVSAKSSGFRMKTLTARQFGLLTKQGEKLSSTPLAKAIFKPTSEEEKRNAMMESFMRIPLFRAVADKFRGQYLQLGQSFRNILERELHIESYRVSDAERILIESAREAGLLHVTGDKTYIRTEIVLPSQPSTTSGEEGQVRPPSQLGTTSPPSGEPQYKDRKVLTGSLVTVSEEDLANLDPDDFEEIWGALGKLIRIRGKRQQTKATDSS